MDEGAKFYHSATDGNLEAIGQGAGGDASRPMFGIGSGDEGGHGSDAGGATSGDEQGTARKLPPFQRSASVIEAPVTGEAE